MHELDDEERTKWKDFSIKKIVISSIRIKDTIAICQYTVKHYGRYIDYGMDFNLEKGTII
jgi:hypothetical protein